MISRRYLWISVLLLFSSVLFLNACGKVTQTRDAEEEKKATSFSVHFSVSALATENLAVEIEKDEAFPSLNYVLFDGQPVYAVVYGIKNDTDPSQLSWGVAYPSSTSKKVSENLVVTWKSKATNQHSVSILKPNLGEAYITLKVPTKNDYIWEVKTTKIKYGFSSYVLALYSNKDRFALMSLDEETASKNTLYMKGPISDYDNFLSGLYWMDLEANDYVLTKTASLKTLSHLFNLDFFELLSFSKPKNTVKSFNAKRPHFLLEGTMEKELLKIVDLLKNTDKEETITYVKKRNEDPQKAFLTEAQVKYLVSNIQSYTYDTESSDTEETPSSVTATPNTSTGSSSP